MSMNSDPDVTPRAAYVKPKVFCGPSRTKQSFKKTADVNDVVARYRRDGALDYVNKNMGAFADVSEIGDYNDVLMKVTLAQDAFNSLPAVIRSRFSNDAAKLISFLDDPASHDEAVKLGLIKPPVVKEVVPPVVPGKAV